MNPPVTVFGIVPAWGLPCVSPFVTKLVFGLRMAGVAHALRAQDPATLRSDSPSGKLPYVQWPDGERMADSSALLERLAPSPHAGEPLELLVQRLIDEHLYWHAAVEPRWLPEEAWSRYRAALFGTAALPPALHAQCEALRTQVLGQWRGTGLGLLPERRRAERARQDVAVLAGLLQRARPFLFGARPGHADAALAAIAAHLLEAPFDSPAAEAARARPEFARHLAACRATMHGG